jgi:hypothetical protein
MAGSTRVLVALLACVAWGAEGCVTGHLFDAARRRDRPIVYDDARVDQDRLVLTYTALVTNDLGQPLGRGERRASLALADLRRPDLPVEDFPVEWLADHATPRGDPVLLVPFGRPPGAALFLEIEDGSDGRPQRLVLHATDQQRYPAFYSSALTRTSTALWVYPLVPLGLAVDAVTMPLLVVLSPVVWGIGD